MQLGPLRIRGTPCPVPAHPAGAAEDLLRPAVIAYPQLDLCMAK
jgi:hypothetical protein